MKTDYEWLTPTLHSWLIDIFGLAPTVCSTLSFWLGFPYNGYHFWGLGVNDSQDAGIEKTLAFDGTSF